MLSYLPLKENEHLYSKLALYISCHIYYMFNRIEQEIIES